MDINISTAQNVSLTETHVDIQGDRRISGATSENSKFTQTESTIYLGENGDIIIAASLIQVRLVINDVAMRRQHGDRFGMEVEPAESSLARIDWRAERLLDKAMTCFKLKLQNDWMLQLLQNITDAISKEANRHRLQGLIERQFEQFSIRLFGIDEGSVAFIFEHSSLDDAERTLISGERRREIIKVLNEFLPEWTKECSVWTVSRYVPTTADLKPHYNYSEFTVIPLAVRLQFQKNAGPCELKTGDGDSHRRQEESEGQEERDGNRKTQSKVYAEDPDSSTEKTSGPQLYEDAFRILEELQRLRVGDIYSDTDRPLQSKPRLSSKKKKRKRRGRLRRAIHGRGVRLDSNRQKEQDENLPSDLPSHEQTAEEKEETHKEIVQKAVDAGEVSDKESSQLDDVAQTGQKGDGSSDMSGEHAKSHLAGASDLTSPEWKEDEYKEDERSEMYERIAQKLAEIADRMHEASVTSDTESLPEGASAHLESGGEAALTDLEREILECMRTIGDRNKDIPVGEVIEQFKGQTYERFQQTIQHALGDVVSWNQLACLFYTTKAVVSAAGQDTKLASNIKEMTLRYFVDKYASWIVDQGGFDSILSDSDSELD